jgi:hypothetical protein
MVHDYTARTSATDLHHICLDLGFPVSVIRKHQLPVAIAAFNSGRGPGNVIFNLDDYGPGSHWVAISIPHKIYFDSYAQVPPMVVPRGYRLASQKKEIQSIESTDCGGLCCLWLYYINRRNGNEKYYHLFKDVY